MSAAICSGTEGASLSATKVRLERTLKTGKVTAEVLAGKTADLINSALSTFLTITLVLALSVFLYGTFYYAYMPVDLRKLPINFQFQPCEDTRLRCSHPLGEIRLERAQKLLQGQSYSMSISLELPDSLQTEDHGMFMTCLTISSSAGHRIGQSCKASLAEYRSPLLRTMETLTYSPALLTGLSSQKQLININFFNNFQTDPHTPAEVITVEVQSKHLQLAQASLEIHAELRGLRFLMYRHPWISALCGVTSNIVILTSIILISWARFIQGGSAAPSTESVPLETTAAEAEECATPEETASAPTPVPVPTAHGKSLTYRLFCLVRYLLTRLAIASLKLFLCIAILLLSYEACLHGIEKPEELLQFAREDFVYIVVLVSQKSAPLLEHVKHAIL